MLNLSTGRITTKWSVVFDDWFATVTSTANEIPNFQTDEWNDLFGDYFIDPEFDDEELEDIVDGPPTSLQLEHRERVAQRKQPQLQPTENKIIPLVRPSCPQDLKDPPIGSTTLSPMATSPSDLPSTPLSKNKMPNYGLLDDNNFDGQSIQSLSPLPTPLQSQPSTPI